MIIIAFVIPSIGNMSKSNKVIKIGSKDFTEQLVLANMFSDLIEEKTDITVKRELNLGGTQVCFSALRSGNIDLYFDYSGTAYGDTLKYPLNTDMEEVYNTVKKDFKEQYHIGVLKQMGFNNTYVVAVRKETAEQYNLKSVSDLKGIAPKLKIGTTFEFLNRADGLPGLTSHYGLQFKDMIGLDGAARYLALMNQETDVVDAFSTDGLLKKFDLVTLEDDKQFFPPYYAIPLIREETMEAYPELVPIIEELGTALTEDIMIDLNYKVDELQMEPDVVARDFLVESGFIKQ